jgi:hypothetical protein
MNTSQPGRKAELRAGTSPRVQLIVYKDSLATPASIGIDDRM